MSLLILNNNFYSDVDAISSMSSMDFHDTAFGKELKDFNFIPNNLDLKLSKELNKEIEVQPNTGFFRKPNSLIHFEQFYQHCLWTCIVALEDTKLKIHEKENIKTIFDVEDMENFILDESFNEGWTTKYEININKNDYILIRPWLWYSLEENNLVQIFLLNKLI